ncbi:MAG: hypothetical protein H0V07_00490 [Propionibacteriales bacterium]|nr:hypothetical protein [Propionibacteriales bacterium]
MANRRLDVGVSRDATDTGDTADLAASARAAPERRPAVASTDNPYGQAGFLQVFATVQTPVAVNCTG